MWTDEERELLRSILDELVPASADGRVPGAGESGVADFFASATAHAPDPQGAVTAVLNRVSRKAGNFPTLDRADKVAVLKEVETELARDFATLVRLTYMGYYGRPEMRPLFGVGSHPVHPGGYPVDRESDELLEELTAPVRARGKIYRDG